MSDGMYALATAGVGDAPLRQCLRCGALIGGWSLEIGTGEWHHNEWHDALDAAIRRTVREEQ